MPCDVTVRFHVLRFWFDHSWHVNFALFFRCALMHAVFRSSYSFFLFVSLPLHFPLPNYSFSSPSSHICCTSSPFCRNTVFLRAFWRSSLSSLFFVSLPLFPLPNYSFSSPSPHICCTFPPFSPFSPFCILYTFFLLSCTFYTFSLFCILCTPCALCYLSLLPCNYTS